LAVIVATPAGAIPRTWVSATGGGAACTRAAPCATFQAAHDATDPNGEINCVDSGAFGGLTISKSITIDCAGSEAAADGAITVNATNATVRLRNLTVRGANFTGILYTASRVLFIENCSVTNSTTGLSAAPTGDGIGARLFVADSIIVDNSGFGIVASATFAPVRVTIDGVRVERNTTTGLRVDSSFNRQPATAHVRNSVLSGNGTGLLVASIPPGGIDPGPGGVASVTADRSSMTLNGTGVDASGVNAFLTIGRSTVVGNGDGLRTENGGLILSYQNNHLTGNAVDRPPNGVVTLK
jgi:hypothetical protein